MQKYPKYSQNSTLYLSCSHALSTLRWCISYKLGTDPLCFCKLFELYKYWVKCSKILLIRYEVFLFPQIWYTSKQPIGQGSKTVSVWLTSADELLRPKRKWIDSLFDVGIQMIINTTTKHGGNILFWIKTNYQVLNYTLERR